MIPRQMQPLSRQPVRVGALERTLEQFNAEIGAKVAKLLTAYHEREVEPLRQRLAVLEAKPKRGRPRKTPVAPSVTEEAPGPSADMPVGTEP